MNRFKRAWAGVVWSTLRENVGWAALVFSVISFLNEVVGAMKGGSLWVMWLTPFISFPFYCFFFTMVGLPYYFLRNLVLPPRDSE